MENKEVKKILRDAKYSRDNGDFANALALLHALNNAFPAQATYRYLLAVTYYESRNLEAALRYAREALAIDEKHKETYELLGDIYTKLEDKDLAEENYLYAYQIDPEYTFVEEKLVNLYLKKENYDAVVKICDNMMRYIPIDISTVKSRGLTMIYHGALIKKRKALIYLKKYPEAIDALLYWLDFKKLVKLPGSEEPYYLFDKEIYVSLFKMYYKLKNEGKTSEYKAILIEHYKVSDQEITALEKEAENDIMIIHQRYP
jgi:tetratricopeptide (TPR) repeat protein